MTSRILVGDARAVLATLESESVHCCVTSPPYFGLRDYGVSGQIGLEPTLADYLGTMVEVFRDVRRVLRSDGLCFLNVGDSYCSSAPGNKGSGLEKWATSGLHGAKISERYAATLDASVSTKRDSTNAHPGVKPKDLMLVPHRLALALQDDGWWVRSDIIWAKKAPMPESVTDRPTSAHEHIFMLSKSARYWYDAAAVREPNTPATLGRHSGPREEQTNHAYSAGRHGDRPHQGRIGQSGDWVDGANQRNVWHLGPDPFPDAHFATFPTEIPRRCIKAGCPVGGTVLDPFLGSGTTLLVADQLGRNGIGIELNPSYAAMAEQRIRSDAPMFAEVLMA